MRGKAFLIKRTSWTYNIYIIYIHILNKNIYIITKVVTEQSTQGYILVDLLSFHDIKKRSEYWGRKKKFIQFNSVQSLSCTQLFATPQTTACQASLSITNSWSLLKLMCIKSVMPFNHLILCNPLLPPSIFPSIRVFSKESVLYMRWPKYWSFGVSISLSSEYSGMISIRMDWLDLLAVQENLKSLLQHHGSKASVLQCSAFSL